MWRTVLWILFVKAIEENERNGRQDPKEQDFLHILERGKFFFKFLKNPIVTRFSCYDNMKSSD